MKINHVVAVVFCLIFFLPAAVLGKPEYKIALITGFTEEAMYQKQVIREINALLESRGDVEYLMAKIDPYSLEKSMEIVSGLMADESVGCIIGVGLEVSDMLIRLGKYPKPTIAAGILDRRLQGLYKTPEGSSGIPNFNYIQAPFDVERDLKTFKTLYNYNHLAILLPAGEDIMFHTLYTYFGRSLEAVAPSSRLTIVEMDPDGIDDSIRNIPPDADAVYLLPLFAEKRDDRIRAIIRGVNQKKLPSFAMMGEKHVRMGAMASIAPDRNFDAVSRRIAINLLDILEGRDAGSLPVAVSSYTQNFVVNVETLKKIDFYPGWAALDNVRFLNLEKLHQGPELQLQGVIREALERNLDLLLEKADTAIQKEDAGMARAALLPQVNLSAGLSHIDKNRVEIAKTHPARTTLSTGASISQTLFTDDLLANYNIQNILAASQGHQEKIAYLDTVVTATRAYINLLFAMSSQSIQNNNLEVTRKNLEIAKNKAAVGAVDASEVNRWESEKAANQISLNDAFRDLQLARMSLNQVLDRPITREFTVADINLETDIELLITDPRVYELLGNIKQVKRFSNFLITEADRNLPELKQIKESLHSQERQVLNRQRALYLPDVTLQGNADKILDEYDARQKTGSDLDHPWTVSLSASWPLFAGGAHKKDLAQSRLKLQRIRMEEKKMQNQFHLNVRSSLETAAVSAREIDLSERGLVSALKSFEIVQAGYAEGRNSVTDLIDAQNAKVRSERSAASAKYQFVLDFLEMERAMGRFHFLDPPDRKQVFLSRLTEYMEIN